jgi:hypothetical protein
MGDQFVTAAYSRSGELEMCTCRDEGECTREVLRI